MNYLDLNDFEDFTRRTMSEAGYSSEEVQVALRKSLKEMEHAEENSERDPGVSA